MESVNRFHWIDYAIFGATLLVSIFIGVFYAFKGGGQKTTTEFLLGDRKMPVLPTALSLLAGILILGISSEMYVKGTHLFWYCIGVIIALPIAATVYQPIFYKLQLTSSYEYLELRFKSRLVKLIGSVLFIASTETYMAFVLYAPATALSGVTGLNLETLIVVSGLACTSYTTLGGLKAVVWTDAFQAVIMYIGFLAIIIQGVLDVGSFQEVWDRAWEGGRIVIDFDPNPFVYMNFWSAVVGTALGWMNVYGTNQSAVQRYTSLSSLRKAQCSLFLVIPGIASMLPLVAFSGLVMYAFYHRCDPLDAELISNRDQLLPYFTVDVLGHVPGLPGIFLACLYSGTLSTVSSGVNSLAAVTWEDLLKPTFVPKVSDLQATRINKLLACGFGVLAIGLACVAKYLGGVLQAGVTVASMLGGPLAGLFLFGMIFPWANKEGALAGVGGSSIIMAWICIGALIIRPYRESLPRSIEDCANFTMSSASFLAKSASQRSDHTYLDTFNVSSLSNPNQTLLHDVELTGINQIYKLSYKLYGLVAILLVFLIGVPVSMITSKMKLDESIIDYLWPGVRYIYCLPKRWVVILSQNARSTSPFVQSSATKEKQVQLTAQSQDEEEYSMKLL